MGRPGTPGGVGWGRLQNGLRESLPGTQPVWQWHQGPVLGRAVSGIGFYYFIRGFSDLGIPLKFKETVRKAPRCPCLIRCWVDSYHLHVVLFPCEELEQETEACLTEFRLEYV